MCGIAGIINFKYPEDYKNLLGNMLYMIRHRGPDSFGVYTDRYAGLGNSRLSIIDLNTGDQPIHNEDKSVWVVLNGEIFNYPELREELKTKGHHFYTTTDTEVLVHLYEEFGYEFLDMLNGQFAFAIWDHNKETLLIARDRVGIHPFFYNLNNNRLIFCSEIKGIFADREIPREIDISALSDVFTCWTPVTPKSVFNGINQLPPGHYAIFKKDSFKVYQYWQLPFGTDLNDNRSVADWVAELKELINDSTRIRLRADVPVGAYLSGGLDSTFITSVVKNNFNNKLRTFSVGFSDERFDESDFQNTAVTGLGTDHSSVRCAEEDIGNIFDKVIWHTETPLLRTGPAPLFILSRLVTDNNFKVVLTGEGADEFFAGYNIFKEDRIRRFWARNPESRIRPLLLKKLYPYIFTNNGKTDAFHRAFFKKYLTDTENPAYSHLLRWNNTANIKNFFSDEFRDQAESLEGFVNRYTANLPSDFISWNSLSRAQYIESSLFLPNYLLSSQGDRMMMGNSVEGRFPFLDHRVIEFACKVPSRYRLKGLTEKFILKKAAEKDIPDDVINRPKQPYRAPVSRCFFNDSSPDYVREMLSDESISNSGYFDNNKVKILFNKCRKQEGKLLSERENMAIIGILSTQLLDYQFIKNFPFSSMKTPENLRIFKQEDYIN